MDAIQVGTVFQSAVLNATGAVVSNNQAGGPGGGIGTAGNGAVTITDSTVSGNTGGVGGGFGDENNQDTLTVENSLFEANSTSTTGGAIFASGPSATITGTLIQNNEAATAGGGLSASGPTLTVQNSTFAGEHLTRHRRQARHRDDHCGGDHGHDDRREWGGAWAGPAAGSNVGGNFCRHPRPFSRTTPSTRNSAITSAAATASGGGIFWVGNNGTATVTVTNTIIAGNVANPGGQPDVDGALAFTDGGGNVIGVGAAGDGFTSTKSLIGSAANPVNPLLGGLADNGGPMVGATGATATLLTELPLSGSPSDRQGPPPRPPARRTERGFLRPAFLLAPPDRIPVRPTPRGSAREGLLDGARERGT